MTGEIILIIGFVAAGFMIWGGAQSIRLQGDRKKGYLMFGVAAVLVLNALILGWPA